MFTNEAIPNTPFRIVGDPGRGYFIALGLHRLCEPKASKRQAIQYLNENSWDAIINTIAIMMNAREELINQAKKQ